MRYALAALLVLLPTAASAQSRLLGIQDTGLNGSALAAAAARTKTIQLGISHEATVHLYMAVTAGTTLDVTVTCEESADGTNFVWMQETSDSGVASLASVSYPVDGGTTSWAVEVVTKARYIRCTFDDEADGTGTVVVRGAVILEEIN